jgi:hypothetical protein
MEYIFESTHKNLLEKWERNVDMGERYHFYSTCRQTGGGGEANG